MIVHPLPLSSVTDDSAKQGGVSMKDKMRRKPVQERRAYPPNSLGEQKRSLEDTFKFSDAAKAAYGIA